MVGRTFFFRVTGSSGGSIWGTDVYTADSTLAVAPVHAGVLKLGQTGIVKVTILPPKTSYQASTRNGIQSGQWNEFPGSYKVEPVDDDDQADDETLSAEFFRCKRKFQTWPGSQGLILPEPVVPRFAQAVMYYRASTIPTVFFLRGNHRPPCLDGSRPGPATSRRRSPNGRTRRRASCSDPKRSGPEDPQTATEIGRGPEATARQVHSLGQVGRGPGHSRLDSHSPVGRRQCPAPDPGSLYNYQANIGKVLYFRVTGRPHGIIWGTDVYTADQPWP